MSESRAHQSGSSHIAAGTNPKSKPWLTPDEQVKHLRSQGVRFDLMSEKDAISYLAKNNNFFRLRSYRQGFARVEEGKRKGQFANLDFKMLVDLSVIDMLLRYEMPRLTLDVEHSRSCCSRILKSATRTDTRSSKISGKLRSPKRQNAQSTEAEIGGKNSPYTRDLIASFPDFRFPVWAFQEVISFGSFNYFTKFCSERFEDKTLANDFYLLQDVRSLRNACAHNNCIINDMGAKPGGKRPNDTISQAVSSVASIGSGQRRSKLSNERLRQIVATLYLHKERASSGVLEHRTEDLGKFAERMKKNIDYYDGNNQIKSGFRFIGTSLNLGIRQQNDTQTQAQS
ncbi:MAG: Abi family protein [Slackia sp.]